MTTKNQTTRSGIGFLGLLGLLFIALKLTGKIAWSWWLVTAPLWGPAALLGVIALIVAVWLFMDAARGNNIFQ